MGVSLNLGVTIVGKLADDRSHFIISDATFSELGLEGLDSSTTTLSDIAPYSYDDRNQLLQSFSVVSDSVFGAIDTFIPAPENALLEFGIELPYTIDLPF